VLAGCAQSQSDEQSEWSEYQLATSHCSGSWGLSPIFNASIAGAPECVSTVTITFDVPAQPPPGFALDRVGLSSTISFCGRPESFTVTSVQVAHQVPIQKAGASGGRSELGAAAYSLKCSSRAAEPRQVTLMWDPSPYFGAGNETLLVSFGEPQVHRDPNDPEVTTSIIPHLGYIR